MRNGSLKEDYNERSLKAIDVGIFFISKYISAPNLIVRYGKKRNTRHKRQEGKGSGTGKDTRGRLYSKRRVWA